jgi:hypothetical protein
MLDNLYFEVWRNDRCGMMSINTVKRINITAVDDLYISLYLSDKEVAQFAGNNFDLILSDGFGKLRCSGDSHTFFKLEIPSHLEMGVMNISFVTVQIPLMVRKMIHRVCKRLWAKLPKDSHRVRITFTAQQIERWMRKYGQGKGMLDVQESNIRCHLSEVVANTEHLESLSDRLQYVKRIALNSTCATYQVATLRLSCEKDCIDWAAYNPHGKFIMNGAIVEREDCWSIHT